MPFNQTTGFSFTESGILAYAPRTSGVYGIYNSRRWIYVGEAQDIEARLLSHVRRESDQSKCIFSYGPTHFVFEQVQGELSRKARERALIAELRPACNMA
jgi:excinuclease UvrABC nuclease subunit